MTFLPLPKPLILPRALPLPPQWLLWLHSFHFHVLLLNNKLQKNKHFTLLLKILQCFFSTDPIKPKFMTMMNICFEQGLVSTGSPQTMQPKITLNFRSSCFSIGRRRLQVCTPIPCLVYLVLGTELDFMNDRQTSYPSIPVISDLYTLIQDTSLAFIFILLQGGDPTATLLWGSLFCSSMC